jgi:hypothetical protein
MLRLLILHQIRTQLANGTIWHLILVWPTVAVLAIVGVTSQGATQALGTRAVQNYEDQGPDVPRLILRALKTYDVPAGIESDGLGVGRNLSVRLPRGTVSDLLNAILAKIPGYHWTEADGVVNVMPDKNVNSLLEVPIRHFVLHDAAPSDIRATVLSLPEVKTWLVRNKVSERSLVSTISANNDSGPRLSLIMDKVKLREILNRIAKTPGLHAWTLSRYGSGRQYVSISIE